MKKKIILKQMENFELFVSWDNSRTCWVLEDQCGETITTFKDKSIFNELEQITSIGDLQNLGLVFNVMWKNNLLFLFWEWLLFLQNINDINYFDYTYKDFKNLPINQISNGKETIYFIVDYTEV